mmetsp:Transcript_8246/g.13474  ORF Transcript_8246/g.13474 Transcript_8246/m.13474 type:complete len:507 (+) Transcript_8246:33-1553(+)
MMLHNSLKAWNNFGVYQHSRIISGVVQIFLFIILGILQSIHQTLDYLPFINNNRRKLSPQLRAVDSILYLLKSLIPIHATWPLFNHSVFKFDSLYLQIFNRITNYGLGALVTIEKHTNISAYTLHQTHFVVCCKHKLKQHFNIDISANCNENVGFASFSETRKHEEHEDTLKMHSHGQQPVMNDYTKFYPHNVEYLWISPKHEVNANAKLPHGLQQDEKIIVYVHGGGYSLGGPSHVGYVSRLSHYANLKILFVHYTKPPIADIPFQVDQILTVYFYLLLHCNVHPSQIIMMGDSAGGGLCTLSIQKLALLNLGRLHPLGVVLYSPWLDLAMDTDSWIECQYHDLIVDRTYVSRSGLIAVGNNHQNLRSPFFSALYASKYEVNCHVMVFVSKHECLYDDSQKLVEKLKRNNSFRQFCYKNGEIREEQKNGNENGEEEEKKEKKKELIYHVVSWMPHAWPIFCSVFPEADLVMEQVCRTLQRWSSRKERVCILSSSSGAVQGYAVDS